MKKTILTIAIVLGVTFGAVAQPQGGGICNYDQDCFDQGLKFQHSRESGHSHGQWSWFKNLEVPKSRVPKSNDIAV